VTRPYIYTIGHSTRSIEELVEMLRSFDIQLLVDVRTAPSSRRYPHFNRDTLAQRLPAAGIRYAHMKDLGGWRRPQPDSPNTGWRSGGFQGYADYMATDQFREALDTLISMSRERRTAFMCAEATPYRCHRSLISDALTARGLSVGHITAPGRLEDHRVTPFARFEGHRVTYPPET
jgi:uncharacterized protein (DUF488 family)